MSKFLITILAFSLISACGLMPLATEQIDSDVINPNVLADAQIVLRDLYEGKEILRISYRKEHPHGVMLVSIAEEPQKAEIAERTDGNLYVELVYPVAVIFFGYRIDCFGEDPPVDPDYCIDSQEPAVYDKLIRIVYPLKSPVPDDEIRA